MLPLDANINPGYLGPGVRRWEGCQGLLKWAETPGGERARTPRT